LDWYDGAFQVGNILVCLSERRLWNFVKISREQLGAALPESILTTPPTGLTTLTLVGHS